ncbi:MAG: hypothetical protein EAZ74_01030 [Alphaproteobacteria bacterium]|nr:MAG: hypothetical protein EAZ74_01030 [Alphaproteobacteria bacterium]TAF75305.1 MAG: hypothetical protein EAZ52_07095 [Alphaproteobacteria bacterium]
MQNKPDHISQADWDSVDSPPLTDEQLASMRPAREVLPTAFWKALEEGRVGRPKADAPKKAVTIRLDPDLLHAFKATGAGWQTRINAILRQHMPK